MKASSSDVATNRSIGMKQNKLISEMKTKNRQDKVYFLQRRAEIK